MFDRNGIHSFCGSVFLMPLIWVCRPKQMTHSLPMPAPQVQQTIDAGKKIKKALHPYFGHDMPSLFSFVAHAPELGTNDHPV